jgi:hypothetical protein
MTYQRRPGRPSLLSVTAIVLLGAAALPPAALAQPQGMNPGGALNAAGPADPRGPGPAAPPPRYPAAQNSAGPQPSGPLPGGPPPVRPRSSSSSGQVIAGPATGSTVVTNAAPEPAPTGQADADSAPPAGSETSEASPSPLPLILGAVGVLLGLVALGGLAVLFGQMSQRISALQRAVDAASRRREPASTDAPDAAPATFLLDDALLRETAPSQSLLPEARQPASGRHDVARLLGAGDPGQPVEVPVALATLAHSVSDLIHHALYAEERLELIGRGVDRLSRGDASRNPEALSRLIDARIATAMGHSHAIEPVPEPFPDDPEPAPMAVPPQGPPSRSTELWTCAERLFRRVGQAGYTEEIFDQALASKKAEILADGSYAQRPDLLRNHPEAQNIAGVLRLAAGEWANRSDEVTIPLSYKTAFADFISDYADAGDGFEMIWANAGESAKDSMHETSRIDGVRHEVVSGVRYPGLRSGNEVYMRAKVAIA